MVINLESNQSIEFTKLPLVEVIFVIEFTEIQEFSSIHFGLFWETIKDEFPRSADREPTYESEDITLPPLRRVAFIDNNNERMIQVQNNSFVYNCQIINSPSNFETYFQRFAQRWLFFKNWCNEQFGESPNPLQYQFDCINVVEINHQWKDFKKSSSTFNFLNENWLKDSIDLTSFKFQFIYDMPDNLGIVKIIIDEFFQDLEKESNPDDEENQNVVIFQFNAMSNELENDNQENLSEWYQSACNCIVKYFSELTKYPLKTNSGDTK
jgi:uncharacterized protein (TIGR04255 family)